MLMWVIAGVVPCFDHILDNMPDDQFGDVACRFVQDAVEAENVKVRKESAT